MREILQIGALPRFAFHTKERDISLKSMLSITHEE